MSTTKKAARPGKKAPPAPCLECAAARLDSRFQIKIIGAAPGDVVRGGHIMIPTSTGLSIACSSDGRAMNGGKSWIRSGSYAAEVIADSSGEWVGNALRFATKAEAETYAKDLYSRWTAVKEWRVVESKDEVNR
jgi:hypothetical protein